MDSLLFLLIAAGIIAVGTTIVVFRAREPKGEFLAVKSFQKEMRALAPDGRNTPADGTVRPIGIDPLLALSGPTATTTDDGDGTPQPAEQQE